MRRRDYLIFGDIEGKLDVLRVECTKRARKGPLQRPQAHREIRSGRIKKLAQRAGLG
jgi:hypothetical protein